MTSVRSTNPNVIIAASSSQATLAMRLEVSGPYWSLFVVPLNKKRSGLHGDGGSGSIIQKVNELKEGCVS